MKFVNVLAPAILLALAACGSSTDASEEATADTVELPADQAMANAPDPVAGEAAPEEGTEEEVTPEVATAEEAGVAAEEAAMDAVAAAEAASAVVDEAAE